MRNSIGMFLVSLFFFSPSAQSEMHKCRNADGAIVYQDRPCISEKATQKIISTPADKVDNDPIAASLKVHETSYMIERMERWCAAKSPATIPTVKQACAAWIQRHDSLTTSAASILQSKLSYEARLKIATQSKLENDAIIAKLENAGRVEHQRWCEGLPAKLMEPPLNLLSQPALVKAVMSNARR